MPSPEAEPTPGRRWNPWEIAPIHGVDTAGIGLLRVRVWRFRRPEITAAVGCPARVPGSCLAPLRWLSQPTQRLTLRLARGCCAPLQNPRLVGSLPEQRAGRFRRPANPVNGPPVAERTALVAARVTPAEHAAWHEKAEAAGVSTSALLREAMARTRTWTAPARAVERERTREIARIGNNLNQLARWANTHKTAAEAVTVLAHLVSFERSLLAAARIEEDGGDAH